MVKNFAGGFSFPRAFADSTPEESRQDGEHRFGHPKTEQYVRPLLYGLGNPALLHCDVCDDGRTQEREIYAR